MYDLALRSPRSLVDPESGTREERQDKTMDWDALSRSELDLHRQKRILLTFTVTLRE